MIVKGNTVEHPNECGLCDRDNLQYLNIIDNFDPWGFCDECFKRIEKTRRLD